MHENRPWENLKSLIDINSAAEVKNYLDELKSEDIVGAVSHLDSERRLKLLTLLQPEDAAEVMDDIPWVQAFRLLEELSSKEAAAIISEMRSDDQADFLSEMDDADAEAIIEEMPPEEAENIRKLIRYDPDCAGGLMITEFLSFDESSVVGDVTNDLRENAKKYEDYNLQYIYVTSGSRFVGVLRMRDLLLSQPNTSLSKIVLSNARTVQDDDSLEALISFFDTYDFYGVPVLNSKNELLGVVLRKHIRETEAEIANVEHLETQGIVGGEELRTMPIMVRSRRRLSWLSVNILLNIMAASIIAFYQETLSSVIALAVFLPIISDMSGCSGNQAVAVSLRELSLGVVKPFEVFRVWLQEASVGLLNGLVLGLLIGIAAWLWKSNVYLGLVVGGALTINTVVAVSLGGTIPLVLKRMKVDPALASGPILTTVTDMFGFFLALTFAGMMLSELS
ncbi:magnesium transporter [Fulvivirga sp. M361]|uniref:magnesium transporter n=1 Tax=Fulvivirga sp. M361 TaxID=2594266 RepID=UPI001179D4C6|nr:magnesium transporter [Fulvivirga sp. M361]TRX58763.1 magnesium transporter [Fulvivirga sp. M361]